MDVLRTTHGDARIVILLAEKLAISLLKKVQRNWPNSLWLFAADGQLHIMKKKGGKRAITSQGGVDQDYVIDTIFIETDGGDW